MNAEKRAIIVSQLGPPDREIVTRVKETITTLDFAPNGEGQNGSFQTATVPKTGVYTITARGAAGALGTYQRTATTEFISTPGHGAEVTADVELTEGDELLIVVGQQGHNIYAVSTDGTAGGSGGATFILRKVSVITDTNTQIEINGQAYEALVVAAGGGGTQDNAYRSSTLNGYDAANVLITKATGTKYSTSTLSVTSSVSNSNVLSLSQLALRLGTGAYYTRGSNSGYGGYGCGSCVDDAFSVGAGWTKTGSYQATSFAINGGQLKIMTELTDGAAQLSLQTSETAECVMWYAPVYDRTQADCVYGNKKGVMSCDVLNRIEADTEYINYCLSQSVYSILCLPTDQYAWERFMYLRTGLFHQIQQNVINIKNAYISKPDTPDIVLTPGNATLSLETVNALEYNIYSINSMVDIMLSMMKQANDVQCVSRTFM